MREAQLMNSERPIIGPWIYRTVLVLSIVLSAIIMYLMDRIDKIIHVQLYGFGLHFSNDWADPYWLFMWIIYGAVAAMIILSSILIALSFINIGNNTEVKLKPEIMKPTQPKTQPIIQVSQEPPPQVKQVVEKPLPPQQVEVIPEPKQQSKLKVNKTKATSLSSCPSCKKTFTQPLVMLDFENGKSKLVNVCPYCNQVLGENEEKME